MQTPEQTKNLTLLPCSPKPLEDPAQYEELHGVQYLTQFEKKDEIFVLYMGENCKFESWGGGLGDQVRLSPLPGSSLKLNSTGYKNPVINSCRFFRRIRSGNKKQEQREHFNESPVKLSGKTCCIFSS